MLDLPEHLQIAFILFEILVGTSYYNDPHAAQTALIPRTEEKKWNRTLKQKR